MKHAKINFYTFSLYFFYIIISGITTIFYSNFFNLSKENIYISAIVGSIIGYFIFIMYYKIWIKFKLNSITEINIKVFGKYLGAFINFINVLCVFILICINVVILYSICINSFNFKAVVLFVLLSMYAVSKKSETFLKASNIFLYLFLFCFIFILLGFKQVELDNIRPFLYISFTNFIKSVILYVTFMVLPIYITFNTAKKKINNNMFAFRDFTFVYIFASIITIIFMFLIIGVSGYITASIYNNPGSLLTSSIASFHYFGRINNFLVLIYVISIFFLITFLINFIKDVTRRYISFEKTYVGIAFYATLLLLIYIFIKLFLANLLFTRLFINSFYIYFINFAFLLIPIIIFIVSRKKEYDILKNSQE